MRASDKAYKALRTDILEWRLPPGSVLAEVEQAARLGISRTPLREALGRLSAEGLTTPGRRGVVVTSISLADIDDLFEVRGTLEVKAASFAAQRGDRSVFAALHPELLRAPLLLTPADPFRTDYYDLVARLDAAIDDATTNTYLVSAIRGLRVHLARVRRLAANDVERLTEAAAEHAAIAEAIAAGNPDFATAATTVHLHRSLSHIKATHREEPHG
ncbi:GntR family transcriptional regulator [Pseudarthrobacter sp. PS3-L1]|uniref:GntR family transcriptional regulator n=1 Tax=Pseudarthrobacter sp. PS3-L1 TaxID=3046207 RepID=UPI0024BADA31|nr:GntR family transcriptional regulator [Pseudarthrobacter sp. PS3-L1]MDJ0320429.1 GntR family transcriptional regulator [Pseudarthrobacter sp. PS3-L1]